MDAREAAKARAEKERLDLAEAREWRKRKREEAAALAQFTPKQLAALKAKKQQRIIIAVASSAVFVVVLLTALGLYSMPRSKLPSLNAVTGKVTRGGRPVSQVYVRLVSSNPDDEASFSVNGFSDDSGQVVIHTIEATTGKKVEGAPEGTYSVRIQTPMDAEQRGGQNFELPVKFVVQAGNNTLPPIELNDLGHKK